MNEKSQLYDWNILEQYLKGRALGQTNPQFEKEIQSDDFLQTVVEGMEQDLLEQGHLGLQELTAKKKKKVWGKLLQMAPLAMADSTNVATPVLGNPVMAFFQNTRRTWDELRYSQFQYILGFNFSCVILILGFCFWVNMVQEEEFPLLSQIEFPGGFKP